MSAKDSGIKGLGGVNGSKVFRFTKLLGNERVEFSNESAFTVNGSSSKPRTQKLLK